MGGFILGNKFSVFHETDLLNAGLPQDIESNQLPGRSLHRQIPEIKNGKVSDKQLSNLKKNLFHFSGF
jgi:hypothetical protein